MPFQAQPDTLTYEPYFGLNEKAFSLNADPRFVYDSPTYLAAGESLLAGIRRREGLQVLTGQIGTGKTTLCRAVVRDLGRHTYSSLVPDPFASREDLLKMLLIDFGVLSVQELTTGPLRQASRTELGYLLCEFLDSLAADAFVVVVVDEAQNLSLPLIEETRILSDTFGAQGRLQIVFVGQPELHAKLKLPEMRQVDQRICGYHRLEPMSREGVAGYIQHRLQVAGGSHDRVLFPPEIVDTLHRRCGGVPRLINRVCDRALQLAYERRADGVNREILDTALIEVGSATLSPNWDAIVYAEPPTLQSAAAPAPTPAPATAPLAHAAMTPPIDDDENFKKAIDHWVAQDLALPPPRTRRRRQDVVADDQNFKKQIEDWVTQDLAPRPARARTRRQDGVADEAPERRPAPRREKPARTANTDWPRDQRSKTYMQTLWRLWSRRAAIALAVFFALNLAMAGVSLLLDTLTPVVLPALPEPPARPVTGLALPEAPLTAVARIAATSVATASLDDAPEYLVAVGLFASTERADQIVDELKRAGLPVMQRPFPLRRQQVQQIVLGPFSNRADAVADLRRLHALGGYDDAAVIESSQ